MSLSLNTIDFQRARLAGEILVWRAGWLPLATILLLAIGILGWAVLVPLEHARVAELAQHARQLERQVAQGRFAKPEEPSLLVFKRALSPQSATNDILRHMYQLARDSSVITVQADFRRIRDNAGLTSQLQIALPVRGSYPAIRHFAFSLLASVPSLSIDQISFKREQIASDMVEAQLIMSVWQTPSENSPSGDGSGAQ